MKAKIVMLCLLCAALVGCTHYGAPIAPSSIQLTLVRSDVEIKSDVTGQDWAFTLFPVYIFTSARDRAEVYAMGEAVKNAHENANSDFVFQPRTKTTSYNFLLFDYATSEVIGKAVKVK